MNLIVVYNSGFAMPEAQKKFAEGLRQGCADTFKCEQFAVCIFEGEMRPDDPTFVVAEGFPESLGPALLANTLKRETLKLHGAAGLNRDLFIKVKSGNRDTVYEHHR